MSRVYVVKATESQEQTVANMIESAIKGREKKEHGLKAILVPEELRGYVLIEASLPDVSRCDRTGNSKYRACSGIGQW